VVAEYYRAGEHGAKQQEHARHVSVEHRVAQQDSYQPEGSARRAESEVKLFLDAVGEAQQDQKNGGDDRINGQQNNAARYLLAMNGKCRGMRNGELRPGHNQKKDRMYQRNDRSFAVGNDAETLHKHSNSVSP